MPLWITLVVVAQLINAAVSLIDRYIVTSGRIGSPVRVAFFISVLSSLSILVFLVGLFPISLAGVSVPSFANVTWPTLSVLWWSTVAAVTFIGGLIALFASFKIAQASDVVPVVSSVSAVATLLLSFYVFDTRLTDTFLWGFLFLVVGTFLVARFRLSRRLVWLTVVSGVLFAAQIVTLKILFDQATFDTAFFWSRIVTAVAAFALLLLPAARAVKVRGPVRRARRRGFILVLFNKALAGLSGLLVLKAVEIGDVSIVQALAGLQFVFLTFFAVLVGHKEPLCCVGEHCEVRERMQKLVSMSIIVTGFVLLFV